MRAALRRLPAIAAAALVLLPAAPAGATGEPTLRPVEAGRTRPIAYLPIALPGEPALHPAVVRGLAARVRARLLAASQGRLRLQGLGTGRTPGDVLPPVRIGAAVDRCDDAALWRTAVARSRVDVTGYAHVVVLYPGVPRCAWVGRAGRPGTNVTAPPVDDVVIHELGHNLGLDHARRLACADAAGLAVPLGRRCGGDEYGDAEDVMGATAGPFSGWERIAAGMLPRARARAARATGSYALARPDARRGTLVLRVPRAGAAAGARSGLCIERRDAGDGRRDGVLVRLCAPLPAPRSGALRAVPGTWLLDLDPGGEGDALALGASLVDGAGGVRVRLDALTPTGARVAVAVRGEALPAPAAAPAAPVVHVAPRVVALTAWDEPVPRDVAATVAWTQPPGPVPVLAYHVLRDGVLVAVLPPAATSWDDPVPGGPGTRVHYRVRAVAAGGGAATAPASTIVLPGLPGMPPVPTALTVAVRRRTATLRWAARPAGSPALRGIQVEQDGRVGGLVPAGARRFVGGAIGAAGTMRLRLRAVAADGTPGRWSAPAVARAAPMLVGVVAAGPRTP